MQNNKALQQLDHIFPNLQHQVWTGSKYELAEVENSEFFCINPLHSLENRKNENVAELRNFLIEFDEASIETQTAAILKLESAGLNIASAVFSGSKSLHLILSMAEPLVYEYRQAWQALSSEVRSICGLEADGACKNEARLSRLAGAIRSDNGVMQDLVHLGGYLTNDKIGECIHRHNIKISIPNSVSVEMNLSLDVNDLASLISKQDKIHNKINNIHHWAKPQGVYKHLFKLTLDIIDTCGAPKSTLLEYASTEIFPYLKAAGYPEHKLDKAINNAYDWKL
jgi:hypothetical protein